MHPKYISIILWLILNLGIVSVGFTQKLYILDNNSPESISLRPYIQVLPDTHAVYTIAQVKIHDSALKYDASNFDNFNHNYVYWGFLTIQTELDYDKLVQFYWHHVGALRLDYLEAWVIESDSIIGYYNFGNLTPESQLIGTQKRCKFNYLIRSEQNEPLLFVFRIKNEMGFKPSFDIHLTTPQFQTDKEWRSMAVHIFYEGLLWIMIVYNLIIFLGYWDKAYLYYSLYIACSAIYSLFFFRILLNSILTEYPFVNPYFWILSLGIGSVFYFQFARYFLDIKRILPHWWDKLIIYFIYLKLALFVFMVVYYTLTFNAQIVDVLVSVGIILETVFGVILIYWLLKTRQKVVYFYMGGSLVLWVGFFTGNFLHMAGIANAQIIGEIGVVGEVLIFSLGLGYRMNQNEVEKRRVKEELILQLEENEKLQLEINTELEGKVKARTAEIMSQQEEIQAQNDEITRANSDLLEAYRHITDSINYARRIQSAILPDVYDFETKLEEFFIFYLPRDVVSGDFYWIKTIDNYLLILVADCTGHGVPGAFLSLLGISFLNEIATSYGNTTTHIQANVVFDELRAKLKHALHQYNTEIGSKDGMDAALCVVNTKTMKMSFAGAHNPLYLVRNGELIEYKGDYMPIGHHLQEKPFTAHMLDILPDDKLYIFSDGFIDQFGGPKDYKYKSKQFKEFLLGIHKLPMHTQQIKLEQEFMNWKGAHKQLDDLLILGFMLPKQVE